MADDLDRLIAEVDKVLRDFPLIVAKEAENFYKQSFRRKGYIDNSYARWKTSQDNPSTLVGASHLMNSIKANVMSKKRIRVRSNSKYAEIHNSGGEINVPITVDSRKFFWAKFYATGDVKYKYMALTKNTNFKVKIEQRQFMGDSIFLERRIEKVANDLFKTRLRKYK